MRPHRSLHIASRFSSKLRLSIRCAVPAVFFGLLSPVASAQTNSAAREQITAALRAGNAQQALTLATAALDRTPRDCQLLSLQAIAYAGLAQQEPALGSFNRALAVCPRYLPALEGAAQIRSNENSPEAEPLLRRVLVLQPQNLTAHATLATLLRSGHRCSEALPEFENSTSLFPQRPDLLEGYGSCLATTGHNQTALAQYRNLLATHPDNPSVRYDVALLEWKTGAAADALTTLRPLLDTGNDEPALALASRIAEQEGDTPRAVELLRSAILLAPDDTSNYLDFAAIAFNHKSFQVGIDVLDAGLRRQPAAAPLYVARGVLEVQLSQGETAVRDFEQAHRLDPSLSFASDALGVIESQQHQDATALALFQTQAHQHPDDPLLQYLLAEQLASNAADPGSATLEAAIAAANRAVTIEPNYRAAHDLLAVLYLRNKQPELAIQQAELALAQDPNDQDALWQKIMAKRRSGQTQQLDTLIARFNQVRKNNDDNLKNVERYRLEESGPAAPSPAPNRTSDPAP